MLIMLQDVVFYFQWLLELFYLIKMVYKYEFFNKVV